MNFSLAMIAENSSEKCHLSDQLRVKKVKKMSRDCNQNSTENESLHIKTRFLMSTCKDFLINLSILDLSNEKLDALPESICLLNNLEHLKVNKIGISSLPSRISNLKSLKYLDASENNLQDLPDSLWNLENLEILNLSFNDLSQFPISCSTLNHLKQLLLSNNRFKSVPECVEEGMKNLEILDLSHNPLKFISPPASRKIKRFSAKGLNYCRFFPEWLLSPKFWKLDEIILDESIFSKYYFRENSISHLKSISMSNSSLNDTTLAKIISNMVELEKINVDNDEVQSRRENASNKFCFLPGLNLKNPGTLKEITARITALSMLPHSIEKFHNLKRLDIGENKLAWLPDEICKLQNLQVLIIDRCGLNSLPKKFGELKKLEEFVVCHNRLAKLPRSMANLKNLTILDLFNNELSEMPACLEGEKLKFLDLEKNLFKTNNPLMRNARYDVLRGRLRQHYRHERDVGSKPYREDDCPDIVDLKSYESCSESEYDEIISDPNGCYIEDWSMPEDSADEYEPTREAKLKLPPAKSLKQYHLTYGSYFRPSDIHSQRVRDVVRRMHRKGFRKNAVCTIEDGQFDDA